MAPVRPSTHGRITIIARGFPRGTQAAAVRAARCALASEGIGAGRLELMAVDDRTMRRLHRGWMGEDSSTDVLTFDLREGSDKGGGNAAVRQQVDGQIIVCGAMARRRATALGVSLKDEISLYVVHGCLHLCGYDDRRRAEAARMHRREDQLLKLLGLGPVFATGEAARFMYDAGGQRDVREGIPARATARFLSDKPLRRRRRHR